MRRQAMMRLAAVWLLGMCAALASGAEGEATAARAVDCGSTLSRALTQRFGAQASWRADRCSIRPMADDLVLLRAATSKVKIKNHSDPTLDVVLDAGGQVVDMAKRIFSLGGNRLLHTLDDSSYQLVDARRPRQVLGDVSFPGARNQLVMADDRVIVIGYPGWHSDAAGGQLQIQARRPSDLSVLWERTVAIPVASVDYCEALLHGDALMIVLGSGQGRSGTAQLVELDAGSGEERRRLDADAIGHSKRIHRMQPIPVGDGWGLLQWTSASHHTTRYLLWQEGRSKVLSFKGDNVSADGLSFTSETWDAEHFYVCSGGRKLVAYALADGKQRYAVKLPSKACGEPTVDDGLICVPCVDGAAVFTTADGRLVQQLPADRGGQLCMDDGAILGMTTGWLLHRTPVGAASEP